MTRRQLRFGIIGSGLMGKELASAMARWCHLTDTEVEPVVVGLCGRNPAHFNWFTRNIQTLTMTSTDYRQLLGSPEIDAIYCAVPHHLHQQLYVDTIAAGKHLLGEKPFGIDQQANAAILDAMTSHSEVVVRCSSQFPFFPGAQRIVQYAREGRFGDILEVESGFLHASDLDPTKPINWKRMLETNGAYGCMGDLGMHALHIPLRLGWVPANVRAILSNVVSERPDAQGQPVPCETWDNATLFCEVPSTQGAFPLTIKTQRIAPGEMNTWYLTVKGTRLSARFSTKYPKTLETMPYTLGEAQSWHVEDLGYRPVYPSITGSIFEFGFGDAIQQMLAAFCDQVAHGPTYAPAFGCATPEETRAHHAILTAALESHRLRQVVSLEQVTA